MVPARPADLPGMRPSSAAGRPAGTAPGGRTRGPASRLAVGFALVALLGSGPTGCGGSGGAADGGDISLPGSDGSTWPTFTWVNSNSGPTFAWSLAGIAAGAWIAAPMNGAPVGGGGCTGFGGSVAPGVAAKSMQAALPGGASLQLWMQPRDQEFAGVAAPDLAAAAAQRLRAFQACVEQDWPTAPVVSGFLCVHEQQLGGDANCDTLAAAFAQGVPPPEGSGSVKYGILGAPGDMNRTDVSAALGEMYEPPYFAPSGACAPGSDGAAYGSEIGTWIAASTVIPARGSVAVPAFGGPSSTCPLDYDQLGPAAEGLAAEVPAGLAGLAVWG